MIPDTDWPETPFLAVDLDLLEKNIARMARTIIHENGKNWRPHVKAIKTPAIAHQLMRAGAIGVTCSKLSEAQVMVDAGIPSVLITNQIVTASKIERAALLNRRAEALLIVDDVGNVDQIDKIAGGLGVTIPLLVEVDVGLQRCGVPAGEQVVALAKAIWGHKHVRFAGLMAWEGHTTRIADVKEKEKAIRDSVGQIVDSAALCKGAGLPAQIVSCGGTGTYEFTSRIFGVTELQAGGGVFGDIRYRDEYHVDHDCALTIWTTVISRPNLTRIVVDAGWKAMARYPTLPVPLGIGGVKEIAMSAEHTRIDLFAPTIDPARGTRVQFIAGYSDSTVFLHDTLFAMRKGIIEAELALLARGKLR